MSGTEDGADVPIATVTRGVDQQPEETILTPKNFFGFQDRVSTLALSKHGPIARIFTDNAYPEVEMPEPPEELDGVLAKNYTIAQEGVRAAYLKKVDLAVTEEQRMDNSKVQLFGTVLNLVGLDSLTLLQEDAEWLEIREACDPLRLWALIRKTHLVQATGLKSTDRKLVRDEYNALRQGSASIAEHSRAFANSVKKLTQVGVVVSEEDTAADFLFSLDDNRYAMLKATVRRNALQGIKAAPTTLKEAVTLAVGWRATSSPSAVHTMQVPESGVVPHPTNVFLARNRLADQTKGQQCYLCNGDHRVMQCPRMEEAAALITAKDKKGEMRKNVMHAFAAPEDCDAVVF